MPYTIKKVTGGYKVQKKGTSKTFSKKPLPLARAKAQIRAIAINEKLIKRKSKYSH